MIVDRPGVSSGTAARSIVVLLVDDNTTFLDLTARFLGEELNVTTLMASNGDAALEMAAQVCPDLTLVDLSMPGMSGVELITRLRTMCPAHPIVALTLHDDAVYRKAAAGAGANAFVAKAAMHAELPPVIRDLTVSSHNRSERA